MKTLTLQIPDNIDLDDKDAVMFFAAHLYEQGKITSGQGAKMAGIGRREFIERLGSYGVSFMNFPASEIIKDFENAKRYSRL